MPSPVTPATSGIGALLRMIEDEQAQAPTEIVPGAEPASAVRGTVATPLETPVKVESPGSSTTVSSPAEVANPNQGQVTPGTSKVGGIGGLPEGVPVTPQPEPEPTPQPTLQEYLDRGKTAAQWYAETGQQSSLDKINKESAFGGVGNIDAFLKDASVANPELQVNKTTGAIENKPKPVSAPNTATLEDYLNAGKTAQQWFAETGRQSQLDALTAGATQDLNPKDLKPYLSTGATQTAQEKPAGQVLGTSTEELRPALMADNVSPDVRAQVNAIKPNMTMTDIVQEAIANGQVMVSPAVDAQYAQLYDTQGPEAANKFLETRPQPTPMPTPAPTLTPLQKEDLQQRLITTNKRMQGL